MPLKACIQIYLNISIKYILIYLNSSQDREFIQNYKKQRNNQNDLDWIIRSINYSRWWKTGIHYHGVYIQSKSLWKRLNDCKVSLSQISSSIYCVNRIYLSILQVTYGAKRQCVCVFTRGCVYLCCGCVLCYNYLSFSG